MFKSGAMVQQFFVQAAARKDVGRGKSPVDVGERVCSSHLVHRNHIAFAGQSGVSKRNQAPTTRNIW